MSEPSSVSKTTSGHPASQLEPKFRKPYRIGRMRFSYDFGRIVKRLGREPDTHLAAEVGCKDHTLVRRLRKMLRIPRYRKTDCVVHLLGRLPDVQIARHLSVAPATITRHRKELGRPAAPRPPRVNDLLEAISAL